MEEERRPSYYSVIPANVRYDSTLPDKAKLLYGEITALTAREGCCWANNTYFSSLYGISQDRVSKLICELVDRGYVSREIIYKDNSKEVKKRVLKINGCSAPIPIVKNNYTPIVKNNEDNNTSNNMSSNYTALVLRGGGKFVKPSIEELQAYISEIDACISAEKFYDYYEAAGWTLSSGTKMKDWKAAVRNWKRRNEERKREEEVKSEQRPYNPYGY